MVDTQRLKRCERKLVPVRIRPRVQRVVSSVVEHRIYTAGVVGPNPTLPTF